RAGVGLRRPRVREQECDGQKRNRDDEPRERLWSVHASLLLSRASREKKIGFREAGFSWVLRRETTSSVRIGVFPVSPLAGIAYHGEGQVHWTLVESGRFAPRCRGEGGGNKERPLPGRPEVRRPGGSGDWT